ncbi:hypothetical protein B0H19DRAFT_574111 [Mycena capillaripes]|nr:hypothetical protein B0H19DRAFT_574111 [Mycena capillaripes]
MLVELEVDRARIAGLEAQISILERSISELRMEKSHVQDRLDSYKYPVLTLPNEIVSEIFIHFLPNYPYAPPLIGILSPNILTQICGKWREIALGTSALWRAVAALSSGVQTHLIDIWLKRSRCSPLSLQVDVGDAEVNTEVLAAVVPHHSRWEHLILRISPPLLPVIEGPTPLLRHLSLTIEPNPDAVDAITFSDAPLLRTVRLNDYAAAKVILPCAQLTTLILFHVYPDECVPILQQTSNLIHCELDMLKGIVTSDQAGPNLMLPYLESLTLTAPLHDRVTDFLGTFIVPALCALEIPESFLEPGPIDSLAAFVSKSGCRLEEVHITGKRSVPERSYHETFPSIPKFSFSGPCVGSESEENSSDQSSDVEA